MTKYEFIKQDLLRRISEGEFSETGRIPSENELSKEYGVSTTTARRTLNELEHAGYIKRIRGKGSFLRENIEESEDNKAIPLIKKGIVSLIIASYEDTDSSFMMIINGAQQVLSSNGYSMTIECSNRSVKEEADIIRRCRLNKVSGILIFSNDPEKNLSEFIALEEAGIPFVMIDRQFEDYPCTVVSSYNYDGMYQVTKYLLEQGHKKIVFLSQDINTNVTWERLAGYKRAMKQFDGEYSEELCLTQNYSQVHLLPSLIKDKGVSAIACLNDRTALEVVRYLKIQGFNIPEDVSVTGFDDTELGRYIGLTSVRQQWREIGEIAAKKLLEMIDNKIGHSQIKLPTELIVRETSGKAPHI